MTIHPVLSAWTKEEDDQLTDYTVPSATCVAKNNILYYTNVRRFSIALQMRFAFFSCYVVFGSVSYLAVCPYCLDKMHKLGQVLCSHHKDESSLQSKCPREAIMKTCKYSKIFPGHSKENIYLLTSLLMFQMEINAKTLCDRESAQAQRCDRS